MPHLGSFFETVARLSLVLLVGTTPFLVIPVDFVTVPQAKFFAASVLLCLAVLAWFLSFIFSRETRLPQHGVFYVVMLLPLVYVISALTTGWSMAAVVSGLAESDTVVTIGLLAVACLIAALTLRPMGFIAVLRALVLGMFTLVLFQAGRLFFPDTLSLGGVLSSETASAAGNWHDFGIMLGLAVILCGSLLTTRVAAKPWNYIFSATAILSFALLVVVSMQDIWFVLAGVLVLFGAYTWFQAGAIANPASHPMRIVKAGFWLLAALAAFLLGWFNVWVHDRLPEPLQVVSVEVRPSWEGTLSVGENSLTDTRSLIFGTGPNSFARNWVQHKPEGVNETLFWNLDFANGVGVVPTSFVTIGVLGILAWALLALAFLWSVGVAMKRSSETGEHQTIIFGLACSVLLLFAFHVMYAPGIAISILLFLLLGVFVAASAINHRTISIGLDTTTQFVGSVVIAAGVVLALVAGGVSAMALTSDIYVNRSVALYNQDGNVANSSALIQKALNTWSSNDRAHRAAVELGILELAQLGQKANTDEAARVQLETTLSQTIEHGLKAVSIDKADYQNWLTLAQLYQELAGVGIQGAYEQAQQAYESAKKENPTSPLPLFRLAQLETLRGNTSNAIDLFTEATKLKRDFAPAYFLQSQLLAQQSRLDDAIAAGAAAVQLVPGDPLGWYNLGVILYVKRSFNEAGAAFAQAVNLRSDYSNALFMLGLTYEQVGQPEQAVAALSRVLELNPNEATLPVMIQNIRTGKDPFEGLAQQSPPAAPATR